MKLGILKSFKELDPLVESYEQACKSLSVDYVILDLLAEDWIENIRNAKIDGLLIRAKGNFQEHKTLFDERLRIINYDLRIPIYPSYNELFLYENKRMYAYWLQAHWFPYPSTHVFYNKSEAKQFIRKAKFPLVFKTNGGASSSGVSIIKSKRKALYYINRIFGINPYFSLGKIPWTRKWKIPIPKIGMAQKHYAIIQDYISIKWEWRIIKIGDSYFGHQKLLKGNFASGSDRVGWIEPPKELLYMIKNVCEAGQFDSMAMDVLESIEGGYYINELQSLFGSFLPYQMKINNIPGRFIYQNNDFVFEEGEFNVCNSNVLRVKDFISKLTNNYYL